MISPAIFANFFERLRKWPFVKGSGRSFGHNRMEAPFYSLFSFQRYNLLGRHAFVALMAIAVRSMQLTWRGFEQDGLAKYIEGNEYVLDELHELIQRMHD